MAQEPQEFTLSIRVPNKHNGFAQDYVFQTRTLSMCVERKENVEHLMTGLKQFKKMATENERADTNLECSIPQDFLTFLAHTIRNKTTIADEDMFKKNPTCIPEPNEWKTSQILEVASMIYIYRGHPLADTTRIGGKLTSFLNNNFEPILNGLTHKNTKTLIDIIADTFPFRRYTVHNTKESYSRNEGFQKLLKNTEDALGNYFSEYLSPTKELDTDTKNNFAANAAKIVNLYNNYGIDLPLPVKKARAELLKNLAHHAFNIAANPLESRIDNILKLEKTLEYNDLNLGKKDPIRYYNDGRPEYHDHIASLIVAKEARETKYIFNMYSESTIRDERKLLASFTSNSIKGLEKIITSMVTDKHTYFYHELQRMNARMLHQNKYKTT